MSLRIITAILIFLSLCLHTSAYDEFEKKEVIQHSGRFKKTRNFNKIPVVLKIQETISEKLINADKDKPLLKINVTKKKNNGYVEQKINSQEFLTKNKTEIVNSAELNSQINDPSIDRKMDKNINSEEYILTKKQENVEEPTNMIKEIIFIKSICDLKKFFESIGFAVPGLASQKDILIQNEETMKNVSEFQNQLEKSSSYQESKKLSQEENVENTNTNQRKLNEEEISGEEITSKRVTTKNRKFAGKQKNLNEEISKKKQTNSKPSTIKKNMVLKNEEQRKVRKYKGNNESQNSISSSKTEKHITNKNKVSSKRKRIKENYDEVVPTEGIKKINNFTKSNKKIKKTIVKKIYNPFARKQLEKELIKEDNNNDSSRQSIEVEEHIYAKPESIEKYIHIENKHPSGRKCASKEEVNKNSDRKSDHYTYPDEDENEIITDYIIVKNKDFPLSKQLEESEEIIALTYDSKKGKTENKC